MTLSGSPIAAATLSPSFELTDTALTSGSLTKREASPQINDVDDMDADTASESERESASASDADSANQTDAASPVEKNAAKRVRFDIADVLEFEPSAWTATVSSDGIPVGMSGTLRRRTRRRFDSFESERCLWRVRREEYMEHGYLEPDERLEILENAGHSVAVISHVEKETIRINRERWESNEYDLMYQYGLGEVPVMEMSDDENNDDLLFLSPVDDDGADDDDACSMMQIDNDDEDDGDCASASNQDEAFYYSARNVLVDAEVRFAMEEMDAYDTRRYDELTVDYAMDCILGDDDDSSNSDENNELPYAKDSFESPLSFALSEMSSSPTDVSGSTESLLASVVARSKASSSSSNSVEATDDASMLRI